MSTTQPLSTDVVVVGAGNAASCAALSAREHGAEVLMLEAAPVEHAGGNSRYTAGAMRFVFNGIDELAEVLNDLTPDEKRDIDFGSYPAEQFFDDMGRITNYRTDPDLCEVLVTNSHDTVVWLRRQGVRFQASFGRQAVKVNGRFKFVGGLVCEVWGGGPGLVEAEHQACAGAGIRILHETAAHALLIDDNGVMRGVRARQAGGPLEIKARSVVLACGGYEANAEMRAAYLGPGWDLARVRGTRFNTGNGLKMALAAGAQSYGHWSGCHAVNWDLNAPAFGDPLVGSLFQKLSYPLGIVVNAEGRRFMDEGADFFNFTYAKYGAEILTQPGMFAWQIFDRKVSGMLREEYRIRKVTKVSANTLEELAPQLEGVDAAQFLQTVRNFNAAVRTEVPFNRVIRDGRCTTGLAVPKSNWANPLDEPPYEAYAITCGITFTFGGVKISTRGEVENAAGQAIPGLYAAGEMVGGLFYHNYPGGTGLTSGAVFGRIAGRSAAGG